MNENERTASEELFFLAHLVMHTGKLTESRLDGCLGDTCLSATRMVTLRAIGLASEPLSLSQLAAQLSFVKSNVTQLVDRLEAEHLVRRIPDPDDRRSILLELTDRGREEYHRALHLIEPVENQLMTLYTSTERQQLTELLGRLRTAWH